MEEIIQQISEHPASYKDTLLKAMITNRATDMYLTQGESPSLRINDVIYRLEQFPSLEADILSGIAYDFMDEFEGERFRELWDMDLGYSYEGRRFRINISKQQKTIMIVCRLLAEKVPTIDELHLPRIFKDLIKRQSGIIILAGPTGSGKSTTLAAMVEEVNQQYAKHIITIEDPIEYVFTPQRSIIEQKQLGTDILSFSSALRSALRQRPDVILFGEMRDLDSVQNAITLAETGHLVLTTVHSKSSAQTINKLVDIFPAAQQNQIRVQLAETLVSVISQRLMKNKEGDGLVSAHEIMINIPAVANLIRENQVNQLPNIIQTGKQHGMYLLEENLLQLINDNIISMETARSVANNPRLLGL